MSTPPRPTWTVEWLGHPSGFPRSVHVFFRDDSVPSDGVAAAKELAERVSEATTEGLFKSAVLTFAERHHLRVVQVLMGPDQRYTGGYFVTLTFEALHTPAVTIVD